MRRAFILSSLTIVGAFVVALAVNIWITWDYVIPDLPNEGRFLAPGLKFALSEIQAGLERVPDRDVAALESALGVPTELLDEGRVAALLARPHLGIFLGQERFFLFVDDARAESFGVLGLTDGRHVLISKIEGMTPFNPSTLPIWIGLSLVVGLAASPFIFVPLSRRLKRLEDTARSLSAGELESRAPLGGPTHTLALALNTMAERTARVLESHEALLRAVAHELRTPTARIRFAVELLAGDADPAERRRRVDALDRDLAELDALIGELLSFARLGVEVSGEGRKVVDAAALIAEVLGEVGDASATPALAVVAEEAGAGEGFAVEVEARSFRRALRNLVLNAARFASARVEVRVWRQGDRVVIAVDDDGPGVPVAERRRIFDAFAVADPSRSRSAGGVGLGLAIVKRIVELHGGSVSCESAPLGGARLVSTWPTPSATPPTSDLRGRYVEAAPPPRAGSPSRAR